ncbi:MAG: FAD-dependent oxidoreductase [Verrucomicrobia bacterium]|nr:FAD-dependent oxidoreductase [Verrucomicrobiota bacterium]
MNIQKSPFRTIEHRVDLCVVGGGMTGLCAAVAAARRGASVVLMQDRPALGGNASSEIGVHIIGADRIGSVPYARETGILEELRLKNLVRNPQANLSMWDLVVYDTVRHTPGLELLLNCSCLDATMDGPVLRTVTGWQLSTQTWHVVHAKIFADCSGDAILAPLTGAEHRMGREAAAEYDESFAPDASDPRTMGMSYIFYTREHDKPMPFVPFDWARKFKSCDDLPWGQGDHARWAVSPWWAEMGGEHHAIHDSELLRDELFKFNLGLWDHIKNGSCVHRERAQNWAIEKVQFVPGRRESRRYVGAHVLSQREVEAGGLFPDVVCHGGWTLDDHHPAGADSFSKHQQPPTIHHPAPSPYGIPYRALYSKNIENLMFAGRVASCTHVAMSSTRVMGTCSVMGQALGTAAALACRHGLMPHGVSDRIGELQQQLLADDVYLPGVMLDVGETTRRARLEASQGDPEPIRDGFQRPVSSDPFIWMHKPAFSKVDDAELAAYDPHSWRAAPGDHAAYHFDKPALVEQVTLILDSNLERSVALKAPGVQEAFPENLPKQFRVEVRQGSAWEPVAVITGNTQRQVRVPVNQTTDGVRFVLEETHGGDSSQIYGIIPR